MNRLYEKLIDYSNEDYYPMHMPGHKRNTKMISMINPYAIDITEIEGFDNLHQSEDILKDLALRIAKLYGSVKSYPLVNGSTAGILAGISAAAKRGDKILIARNSHKSVYHATVTMDLDPIYVYPEYRKELPFSGGILPEKVEEMLIKHNDIKLVVITSPTYEGVVSDIKGIAKVAHRYGAILLVDEAHGAHFGFHEAFPESAVTQGADIVIQSLHKTLPAFTQTAVLHSNRPELERSLEQYLAIYETSSPSYVLMAGIDRCVSLLEDNAKALFHTYAEMLDEFYDSMKQLNMLQLINRRITGNDGIYDMDPGKLTITTKDTELTGHQLNEYLREQFHIVMEMEAADYVLGMTSICDSKEGFLRLQKALVAIDRKLTYRKKEIGVSVPTGCHADKIMTPSDAIKLKVSKIKLRNSNGRISASFISLFPPGSPVLVPGERIDGTLLHYLEQAKREGLTITGLSGDNKDEIEVVNEF